MPFKHFKTGVFAVTLFLLFIQTPLNGTGIDVSSSPPRISTANKVLLSAASPFEDLIEYAMAGDRNGIREALKEYDRQAAGVMKVLSPEFGHTMEDLVTSIKRAQEHADNKTVAFKSLEAYRLLTVSLDPNRLVVPVQVSLLDYEGFRLITLLRFRPDDWPAVQKASGDARRYWITIKPRIKDMGLADAVDTMVAGMVDAAHGKNREMAIYAAKMDLALVDLLESYFKKT